MKTFIRVNQQFGFNVHVESHVKQNWLGIILLRPIPNFYETQFGLNNICFEKVSHTNVQNQQLGFGQTL